MRTLIVRFATFYQWLFPISVGINLPAVLGLSWNTPIWVWVGTGILVVLLIFRAMVYRNLKKELEQVRRAVKTGLRHLLLDTQDVLTSQSKSAKDQFEQMLKRTPSYIVPLAGKGVGVQAQFFEVREHGDHEHFVSLLSSNSVFSRNHFSNREVNGVPSDDVGFEVWKAARSGVTRLYPNLSWWKSPFTPAPKGWRRWRKHDRYKCFVTAPVFGTNDQVVGLLTINASKPWALTEVDAEIIELFANGIQIAHQKAKSLDTFKPYADIVRSNRQGGCQHDR